MIDGVLTGTIDASWLLDGMERTEIELQKIQRMLSPLI
jgi:hypothetical protein